MIDSRSFVERFEAIDVHKPMKTGELDADLEVQEVSEKFFKDIIDSLQLGRRALTSYFEIETKMLVPFNPEAPNQEQPQYSDESIRSFKVKGDQTLAIIHKTRNDFNFQIVSFAKFEPSDLTIETVESLQRAEGIIDGRR